MARERCAPDLFVDGRQVDELEALGAHRVDHVRVAPDFSPRHLKESRRSTTSTVTTSVSEARLAVVHGQAAAFPHLT